MLQNKADLMIALVLDAAQDEQASFLGGQPGQRPEHGRIVVFVLDDLIDMPVILILLIQKGRNRDSFRLRR